MIRPLLFIAFAAARRCSFWRRTGIVSLQNTLYIHTTSRMATPAVFPKNICHLAFHAFKTESNSDVLLDGLLQFAPEFCRLHACANVQWHSVCYGLWAIAYLVSHESKHWILDSVVSVPRSNFRIFICTDWKLNCDHINLRTLICGISSSEVTNAPICSRTR